MTHSYGFPTSWLAAIVDSGSALQPVVHRRRRVGGSLEIAAFGLLAFWRAPPWLVVVFAVGGGGVALAKVTGLIEVDLLSFFAAAAAVIAWERARQDSTLARAYSLAAQELAIIGSLVGNQDTEDEWARFVDHAEAAVSREHTLWRASHT